MKISQPKKLLDISRFKTKVWLTYKDTTLMAHKTRENAAEAAPFGQQASRALFRIEIKRAELTPDISIKDEKFIIKIKPHER